MCCNPDDSGVDGEGSSRKKGARWGALSSYSVEEAQMTDLYDLDGALDVLLIIGAGG